MRASQIATAPASTALTKQSVSVKRARVEFYFLVFVAHGRTDGELNCRVLLWAEKLDCRPAWGAGRQLALGHCFLIAIL